MSFSNLLKGFNISIAPKAFFKSSRFDKVLLRDLPVRDVPAFMRENMGSNGWYRINRFFRGNFPAGFWVAQTGSIVSLLAFAMVPSAFNFVILTKQAFEKYNVAKGLLITEEQWEELTVSQKHHFTVYLAYHLMFPEPQPPHLPPPVEFVPSHWKDDPNAPIYLVSKPNAGRHH